VLCGNKKEGERDRRSKPREPIICPTSPNENPESNQDRRLKRQQVRVKTKQIPKLPCPKRPPRSSEYAGVLAGTIYLSSEVVKALVLYIL
jgi:hypothetical protein